MTTSASRTTRRAVFAGAALLAVVGAACGSGDGGITAPTLPSSSTTAESTTSTTERSTTTTTERTTTTSSGESTTTTSGDSTTTTAEPTTTTTQRPTTTTTERTTTTRRSDDSTTTTEATTTTATIDGEPAGASSDTSPWLWVGAVALLLLAVLLAVVAAVRSRKAKQARWLWGARDVAGRSTDLARRLDQAAGLLSSPAGVDRQVWLDASETLAALAASAAALVPDAPKVPGDPEGTNSLATGLEALRSDLTVCRSAVIEAERTRFELVGPTEEQLGFSARSVQQSAAAVVADAHSVTAATDRIDPPAPAGPPGTPPR